MAATHEPDAIGASIPQPAPPQRRTWLLLLVLLYTPLVIVPHEWVQGWLAAAVRPIGLQAFYVLAGIVGILWIAGLTAVVGRRLPSHVAKRELAFFWALTLVLMAGSWHLLSVNNSELVHFPQYALSGFVLLWLTRSVVDTLCWVMLAASLDEGYQYAVLHPTWGIPFDFNDVYLDLLGGAAGCLLAVGFMRARPVKETAGEWFRWLLRRPGVCALLGIVVLGLVLISFGKLVAYQDQGNGHWIALSRLRPKGFWFFDATWGPRRVHTLSPWEGPALIALTLAAYAVLDRRYRLLP